MKLRAFNELKKVVSGSGSEAAKKDLEWLLKLAQTNFAACYDGLEGFGGQAAAECELRHRFHLGEPLGEDELVWLTIVNWLYSQAREKCYCHAPGFIAGCDNALVRDEEDEDICICGPGECPWRHCTGVFE